MDKIIELLLKQFGNKYNYLKLYDVTYDSNTLECVVTFLYPHDMYEIDDETRKEIQEFVENTVKINGKMKVKFKKSFLDVTLIKKEVLNFIQKNYKAISIKIKENQIIIDNKTEITKIKFILGKEVNNYFVSSKVSYKLCEYLKEKFISEFEVDVEIDEKYNLTGEIGEVELPTLIKKNKRYQVEIINKLFGGEIAPSPEFIADNKEPKNDVILAGKISEMNKKTFTRKKGARAGEEGKYYTFTLNDDKKIECIYFCPKSNERRMDVLVDDMTVVCVGDIKLGLGGKLTYYIKRLALAHVIQESKEIKVDSSVRKPVVIPEDYIEIKQADFLTGVVEYNDFIMENNFVVYDLETTGLDTANDRLIELGAVKIEDGEVTKKFSTFVNPEMHIPDEASRINNITDDMVADAPKILDVMLDFKEFTKGCIICGYNNINFDDKFITRIGKELNIPFDNRKEDVFILVRQAGVRARNYKLTTVVEALGLTLENAHRAYNDAYATAQVLLKINEVKKN